MLMREGARIGQVRAHTRRTRDNCCRGHSRAHTRAYAQFVYVRTLARAHTFDHCIRSLLTL